MQDELRGRSISPPHTETDADPIARRLEGLLRDYGHLLRRAIARTCPPRIGLDLDEIEQDARVRLWRALEGEIRIEAPASFFYRVAVTAALDALRRTRSRKESLVVGDVTLESAQAKAQFATREEDGEARASRRDLARQIRTALGSLPEPRRLAVALHLQGFNVREIAGLLDWSEARARNLAHRGMQQLRRILRAKGIEP